MITGKKDEIDCLGQLSSSKGVPEAAKTGMRVLSQEYMAASCQ